MDGIDYWRLCDELTVVQAALLIAGEDPSDSHEFVEEWEPDKRPTGYEAAKMAVVAALRRKTITGKEIPHFEYDINGNMLGPIEYSVNVTESTVDTESLCSWLSFRGFNSGFFFPDASNTPGYLDPKHPRYAPKLAAAVHAWLALEDENLIKSKSPKRALDKWIREHAVEFGLTDEEGNPVNQAVEECSKVANWSQSGGAPKTPTA